ncbi:MAG: hypothetical protein ABJP34_02780 [Erythrobacter sp.]
MFLKQITAGMALIGLATAPVMAQAAAPATAPVEGENALGGEDNGGLFALIGVVAVLLIGAFTLIDDTDQPVSP